MKMRKVLTALLATVMVLSLVACGGGTSSSPAPSASQAPAEEKVNYPDGQITMIIPWAAGGASDTMARLVSEPMSQILGVPMVVTNQTGASGTVGTQAVADAKADGYTLLAHTLEFCTAPALDLTDYTQEDFEWIGRCTMMDFGLVTRPGREWNSLEEMIAYAKDHPGELKCGTAGAKSAHSVCLNMLSESAGVTFMEVPFDGGSSALAALLGDNVDFVITALGETTQYVNDGDMILYALMGSERNPLRPDTPTFTELGYANMELTNHVVFGAPKGTPEAVMEILRDAFKQACESDELYDAFWERGQVLSYLGGPETYEYLKDTTDIFMEKLQG